MGLSIPVEECRRVGLTSTRSIRRWLGELAAGGPVVLVEELELQGVEEAFGHRVELHR